MKFSASQAAQEVGKSIPTITRAIKSGKLSAAKLNGGGYEIEPSELFRVFDRVTPVSNDTPPMLGRETPSETKVLQAEIESLRERLADKDDVIGDLRRRLDDEAAERRQLSQRLLAAPAPAADAGKRSWWSRLKGND